MWYYSGSGRIQLNITLKDAQMCSHAGRCDDDVQWIMENRPKLQRQLAKIDPEDLKKELDEYGAWDDGELSNHQDNLKRLS